jgi:alpha-mannosidase
MNYSLLIIMCFVCGLWKPVFAEIKKIYIAPDDHTDYMWTANESTYRDAFLEMTDYYLNLADQTSNEPSEYQSRWSCDGSFWMWIFEKNRSTSDFERLINRIRTGHVSVPLNPLVQALGGTPAEAVLRGMYYAGQVERRFDLRFPLAYSIEDQTLPYGLVSLWAGSGAKYSWKGICNCASRVPSPGNREHPIYWWTGMDGSKILMKWYSMTGGNDSLGGYAEARYPSSAVDQADALCLSSSYPYNIAGVFGKGWDDLKTLTSEFMTVAKNKTTTNRKVIVSNELDFFQDFEATYGTVLPSSACSFGNEWELYVASMAEVSARAKRAVEKLRSAESLVTMVSFINPNFISGRTSSRDLAWMNLGLYWEHDWTADGPISRTARANWQRRLVSEIDSYTDTLYNDAAIALAGMIRKSGSNLRFYALNPLSWTRTDFAEIPFTDTNPVHVIDLTSGIETPSQIVTINSERRLRILAKDVPSIGYKVFEVRPGSGQNFLSAATVTGNVIENQYYKITVADRGAITSLIDKTRNNREFAQIVNNRAINDLGSGTGTLQVENAGPVSVTLVASASSPFNHTTRLTLFRDSKRIDIRNEINQNFGNTTTWGFGFNLTSPDVWHEEVGAVLRARLLPNGGHYSSRNARYDWLTLNHFADITGSGLGVTLSNADCFFMKLGNSSTTSLDESTPMISVLAGGQVDGTSLGIPNQGGDTNFLQRFALQTHDDYNEGEAMRFALEHQNPFITTIISGGNAYPENTYSFVTVSTPNVLIWALKPSEEGISQGTILRAWNLSSSAVDTSFVFDRTLIGAKHTTHIETDLEPAEFSGRVLSASFARNQIQTFRVTIDLGTDITPPAPPKNLHILSP